MCGLALAEPNQIIDSSTPFATPLEILPEWYLFPTFHLLRILPEKCIGILSMLLLPMILLVIPLGENTNKYQNPFRRPTSSCILLNILCYSIWLSIGSLVSLTEALPLIG